jgi:hypothetical protein
MSAVRVRDRPPYPPHFALVTDGYKAAQRAGQSGQEGGQHNHARQHNSLLSRAGSLNFGLACAAFTIPSHEPLALHIGCRILVIAGPGLQSRPCGQRLQMDCPHVSRSSHRPQAAERLCISRSTLRRWKQAGKTIEPPSYLWAVAMIRSLFFLSSVATPHVVSAPLASNLQPHIEFAATPH